MSLLFNLITIVSLAHALPCSGNLGQIAAHMSLITKTMTVDEIDRMTLKEYAAVPENQISLVDLTKATDPTGSLICPWGKASANLVEGSDVLVVSAHDFYDIDACKSIGSTQACKFQVGTGKNAQTVQISGEINKGDFCSNPIPDKEDWMVVRLAAKVKGVVPYKLPSVRNNTIKSFDDIVAVGASSHDFIRAGIHPKHIGNCKARDPEFTPSGGTKFFYTNCDAGLGASGGAILKRLPNQGFEFVGMIQSGSEITDKDRIKQEQTSGVSRGGAYSKAAWNVRGIGMSDKLYDTIVQAAGGGVSN